MYPYDKLMIILWATYEYAVCTTIELFYLQILWEMLCLLPVVSNLQNHHRLFAETAIGQAARHSD